MSTTSILIPTNQRGVSVSAYVVDAYPPAQIVLDMPGAVKQHAYGERFARALLDVDMARALIKQLETAVREVAPERVDPVSLKVNPKREGRHEDFTGIYVRAQRSDGTYDSVDFTCLDRDSLIAWLRSRGPVSDWAMSVLLFMCGYPMTGEAEQ